MTTLWITYFLIHVGSIAFTLLVFWRLYYYIRRYRFEESKYTLLFGFIHLSWVAAMYLILSIGWIFVSFFIFTLQ